jgi:hypothetical protein
MKPRECKGSSEARHRGHGQATGRGHGETTEATEARLSTWHLRRAWTPLTFTDQDPPVPGDPVAPARRSAAAQAKASYQHDQAGQPYYSFRGLLEHLATLTRNQVRYTGTHVTIAMLTEPTSTQRHAFELLGATIPLTLK